MNAVSPSRRLALQALMGVRQGQTVSEAMAKVLRGQTVKTTDRALLTQIVYGVLRHRRFLDAWIKPFRRGTLDPSIEEVLRMAFFQVGFLSRVPTYAVVNEAVEQAKQVLPRAVPTVNAILRRGIPHKPSLTALGERYSHPDWLVERWRHRFGERVRDLLEADNRIPPLTLRVNEMLAGRDQVLQDLQGLGIQAKASPYLREAIDVLGAVWLEDLPAFHKGWVTVQDASGMLVAHVLNAQKGDQVLDLAAGLGSKTTHVLERTPTVKLTAVDLSSTRLGLLHENLVRIGRRDAVTIVEADARQWVRAHSHRFDRVILDAPCSGLGVLRRRVDARWRKGPKDIMGNASLQNELLDAAVTAVRPGGVIVYSTCSIEPEETTEVIDAALQRWPQLMVDSVAPYLPSPSLRPALLDGNLFMVLPGQFDMDGFFICRLIWRGSSCELSKEERLVTTSP